MHILLENDDDGKIIGVYRCEDGPGSELHHIPILHDFMYCNYAKGQIYWSPLLQKVYHSPDCLCGLSSWVQNGDVLFPVRYKLNLYMLRRRK
jgi:hypothetical protein